MQNLLKYTAEKSERERERYRKGRDTNNRGSEIERKIRDNSRLVCRQPL